MPGSRSGSSDRGPYVWLVATTIAVVGSRGLLAGRREVAAQAYLALGFERLAARTLLEHLTRGVLTGLAAAVLLGVALAAGGWAWRHLVVPRLGLELRRPDLLRGWLRRVAIAAVAVVTLVWLHRRLPTSRFHPVSLAASVGLLGVALAVERLADRFGLAWMRKVVVGVASLLVCATAGGQLVSRIDRAVAPAEGPNVVLISLDTLRADALSIYGGPADISPSIDALARRGTLFAAAMAPAPWTLPSHMSMLTGLYPSRHGLDTRRAWQRSVRLDRRFVTLAELLAEGNYRTRGITEGGFIASIYGFADGFDRYDDDGGRARNLERAVEWIERAPSGFFLFFHTYAVHAPYRSTWYLRQRAPSLGVDLGAVDELEARMASEGGSPKAMRRLLAELDLLRPEVCRALYLGGVRSADRMVESLLTALDGRSDRESTLVVLTSDHGEEFAEHNEDAFYDAHSQSLFEVTLEVPLMISGPGVPRRVVDAPVSLVDLPRTIADLSGLVWPQRQGSGRSLFADGEAELEERFLFAQSQMGDRLRAVRLGEWKLIENASCRHRPCVPSRALYNLARDPAERSQVEEAAAQPVAELLGHELERHVSGLPPAEPTLSSETDLDSSVVEQLRALGYVDR